MFYSHTQARSKLPKKRRRVLPVEAPRAKQPPAGGGGGGAGGGGARSGQGMKIALALANSAPLGAGQPPVAQSSAGHGGGPRASTAGIGTPRARGPSLFQQSDAVHRPAHAGSPTRRKLLDNVDNCHSSMQTRLHSTNCVKPIQFSVSLPQRQRLTLSTPGKCSMRPESHRRATRCPTGRFRSTRPRYESAPIPSHQLRAALLLAVQHQICVCICTCSCIVY